MVFTAMLINKNNATDKLLVTQKEFLLRRDNTKYHLECQDGHPVYYINGNGKRRAHFRHKTASSGGCDFEKILFNKYGPGGESEEHLGAKLGLKDVKKFIIPCRDGRYCGNKPLATIMIDHTWTFRPEQRCMYGRRYIYDGVFYDQDGEAALIVEIKHSHATTGSKENDLINNTPIQFIECDTDYKILNHNHRPDPCVLCIEGHKRECDERTLRVEQKRRRELDEERERHRRRFVDNDWKSSVAEVVPTNAALSFAGKKPCDIKMILEANGQDYETATDEMKTVAARILLQHEWGSQIFSFKGFK